MKFKSIAMAIRVMEDKLKSEEAVFTICEETICDFGKSPRFNKEEEKGLLEDFNRAAARVKEVKAALNDFYDHDWR